ncbi:D-cysteine desulfhydrase family protein [candidate division KSB1 bacterium]|nr:D-cysteine desulfhydrase family protein [candidate division KSB1 bacterium]
MNFNYPDRIKLANLPTPIVKLRLGEHMPKIYLKRDDMTGVALSGNKIRKLEFVVVDAINQGADTLITCGGIQSNHARATAVAAAMLGMKSFLVLRGEKPDLPDGNLLIDHIFGSEFRFITPDDYRNRVMEIMEEIAADLVKQGRKPYIIPEGASDELGAVGYIHAVKEIKEQTDALNIKFDALVCATGSGGTQAGLIMGSKIHQLDSDIIGFNVCDDESYFKSKIKHIIKRAEQRFDCNFQLKNEDIKIIDGYVGLGYALNKPDEIEFIKHFARLHGIFLDPVYTGKAMFGLYDQIQKNKLQDYQQILFLHTGGFYGLFPKRDLFAAD